MECQFYPYYGHARTQFAGFSGCISGLLDGMTSETPLLDKSVRAHVVSLNMPKYDRLLFNDLRDTSFHLCGYGTSRFEALTRLNGEAIERYAFISAGFGAQLQAEECRASFRQMVEGGRKVPPFEYLSVYTTQQRANLAEFFPMAVESVSADTPLSWVPCRSLYHQATEVWLPKQLFAADQKLEPFLGVAMSTGTASHRSFAKALENALLEYLQIHAFNLMWYAELKGRKIVGQSPLLARLLASLELTKGFELIPVALQLDPRFPPLVVSWLLHRQGKSPNMLCGIQGDPSLENAYLRSALEGSAIAYSFYYQALMGRYPDVCDWPLERFADLDANVMYYAQPEERTHGSKYVRRSWRGEVEFSQLHEQYRGWEQLTVEDRLAALLSPLKDLAPWACYRVITPPEVGASWSVVRVFIPEFIPMVFPGYPPANHPAFAQYEGVSHAQPHPLP